MASLADIRKQDEKKKVVPAPPKKPAYDPLSSATPPAKSAPAPKKEATKPPAPKPKATATPVPKTTGSAPLPPVRTPVPTGTPSAPSAPRPSATPSAGGSSLLGVLMNSPKNVIQQAARNVKAATSGLTSGPQWQSPGPYAAGGRAPIAPNSVAAVRAQDTSSGARYSPESAAYVPRSSYNVLGSAPPVPVSNAGFKYEPNGIGVAGWAGLEPDSGLSDEQLRRVGALSSAATGSGGAGAGGGGYAGVPSGVDPVWYRQFMAEHDGKTPEEVYKYSENPLGQALWDKAWGDQFFKGNYRAPTEEDWRNSYGSRYRNYITGANIYGQGGSGGGGYGGYGGGGGGAGSAASSGMIPNLYNAGFELAFGQAPTVYYTPERGGAAQMQKDYYTLHDQWQNYLGRAIDPGEWERIWRDLLSYKAGRSNQAAPLTMADIYGYTNRLATKPRQAPDLSYLLTSEV